MNVIDLGQHWLRWWLGAWRHQAINWTSIDLSSVESSDIYLSNFTKSSITEINLKISSLKFHSNLLGANELTVILQLTDCCVFEWWIPICVVISFSLYWCVCMPAGMGFVAYWRTHMLPDVHTRKYWLRIQNEYDVGRVNSLAPGRCWWILDKQFSN